MYYSIIHNSKRLFNIHQHKDVDDSLLIKLTDMVYNSWNKLAENALNRMYKNVCELLRKKEIFHQFVKNLRNS